MLGQAALNSALAFTSCLHKAWRSARRKSLRSSQIISEDAFCPRHSCRLLESPECVGVFQSLYSPGISFPRLFLPRLFGVFLTPTLSFCPRQQHLIYLSSNFFGKHCPESHLSPREILRQAKQSETPKPILQGAISKVQTHNDNSLRKSILLLLVSATCTWNMPCYSKPLPHWGVGDGNRVN